MEDVIIHEFAESALAHVCFRVLLILRRHREHDTGVPRILRILLYRACTGSAQALLRAVRWLPCVA